MEQIIIVPCRGNNYSTLYSKRIKNLKDKALKGMGSPIKDKIIICCNSDIRDLDKTSLDRVKRINCSYLDGDYDFCLLLNHPVLHGIKELHLFYCYNIGIKGWKRLSTFIRSTINQKTYSYLSVA